MIKLILIPLFIVLVTCCHSQQLPRFETRDTVYDQMPMFLVSVNGKPPIKMLLTDFDRIKANQIENAKMLKDDPAVAQYGEEARHGVIIIILKQYVAFEITKILNTEELLKAYHIKNRFRSLPLYIDSNLIINRKPWYFHLADVKSVKVDTDVVTGTPFINLQNKRPMPKPEPGVVYIRGIAETKK